MKNLFRVAPLLLLPLLLSACVVSIGGKATLPPAQSPPPYSAPPPPPIGLPPAEAATDAEIDAAARLSHDSAKLEAFNQIARRTNPSPAIQVHLVNVAYRSLSFDNNKVQLLQTVIANPDFSDAARQAIVSQLDHLSFDSNKQ